MSNRLERFQRRLEKLIGEEEESIVENQFDAMIGRALHWLIRNLLPTLTLALIINITLMFVTPADIIMSRWFWLKDPLSIVAAFAIVGAARYFFSRCEDHV